MIECSVGGSEGEIAENAQVGIMHAEGTDAEKSLTVVRSNDTVKRSYGVEV